MDGCENKCSGFKAESASKGIAFIDCESEEEKAVCCISYLAGYYGIEAKELITLLRLSDFCPSKDRG